MTPECPAVWVMPSTALLQTKWTTDDSGDLEQDGSRGFTCSCCPCEHPLPPFRSQL